MKVKELIIELLSKDMSEEVYVGKKRVRRTCAMESDSNNPRYYTELLLED